MAQYLFFFHAGVTVKYLVGGKLTDVKIPSFMLPAMLCLWLAVLFGTEGFGAVTAIIRIITCFIMAKYEIFKHIFSHFSEYSL